uniref:Uncharacterized protein n=1 Tax=Anguilla anguilla TaxID=7936 RepID=A0A0E9UZ02_ANGAN
MFRRPLLSYQTEQCYQQKNQHPSNDSILFPAQSAQLDETADTNPE